MTRQESKKGFTVPELLVVLAISGLIATISISGLVNFSRQNRLADTAYEVASVIREVQSYAYFVKAGGVGNSFDTGYGIQFGTDAGGDANGGKSFVSFGDLFLSGQRKGDYVCNSGDTLSTCSAVANAEGEFIRKYTLAKGVYFESMCVTGATERCYSFLTNTGDLARLSIVFLRPNPASASIHADGYGPNTFGTRATVRFRTPDGAARNLVISASGQIYVE